VCVAPRKDGEACDSTRPCMAPAACISGVCAFPDPAKCP
jgi:hypothetical protein